METDGSRLPGHPLPRPCCVELVRSAAGMRPPLRFPSLHDDLLPAAPPSFIPSFLHSLPLSFTPSFVPALLLPLSSSPLFSPRFFFIPFLLPRRLPLPLSHLRSSATPSFFLSLLHPLPPSSPSFFIPFLRHPFLFFIFTVHLPISPSSTPPSFSRSCTPCLIPTFTRVMHWYAAKTICGGIYLLNVQIL